jgi:hypothetical protein
MFFLEQVPARNERPQHVKSNLNLNELLIYKYTIFPKKVDISFVRSSIFLIAVLKQLF